MSKALFHYCSLFMLLAAVSPTKAAAVQISFVSPKPNQVVQRVAFDPLVAVKNEPGHASFGFADIALRANLPKRTDRSVWEYRAVLLPRATGRAVDWTPLDVRTDGTSFEARARVPAGGWYRIDIRARFNEEVTHEGSVEPVGVGEVFLIPGQSYATNCNDERLKVSDPQFRVVAFDSAKAAWQAAHDPQPVPDGSEAGSIWPPVGDGLLKEFRVPIGFANVAVGGTSSSQWLPGGELHRRLVIAGKELGRFRCVLWQQGESDVIAQTTTEKYVENARRIRHTAADAWKQEHAWLLAKSTLHPTVYNDPKGEGRIRAAIDILTSQQGFEAGPDTDTLTGENRGGPKSKRHFSPIGQRRAADMWLSVLKPYLHSPRSAYENLADLRLLEPVWSSPVIHRESSILLQSKPERPAIARLAFSASEALEVVSANQQHHYQQGRDFTLSEDGLHLTFTHNQPVEPVSLTDLFVPNGSPHSYKHRAGNPEVSLLYRPGRWFHDRNVEVSYRRKEKPAAEAVIAGSLPKTQARLKAGKKLILGVSGDSISTGLDASVLTKATPYQPGYADLVAAQLRAKFRVDVAVANRAVSGWSVANGLADLDKLLVVKPDLIVVAYGMNDVGRRDPKWFGQRTREILTRVRKELPEAEVILVSPMLGNGEWVHTPREMFARYRDELKSLSGGGTALADVTAVAGVLPQLMVAA